MLSLRGAKRRGNLLAKINTIASIVITNPTQRGAVAQHTLECDLPVKKTYTLSHVIMRMMQSDVAISAYYTIHLIEKKAGGILPPAMN